MEQPNTVFGQVAFTEEEIRDISEILQEDLPIEEVSSRPGPAGTTLTYLESWRAINLANKIFKFNGWSSSIKDLGPDFIEEIKVQGATRYKVGVTAVVRITLKDGTFQEDVGYGCTENPSKGTAIENAKKEAVSDARKRALRLFGDGLGNSLYDKEANKSMGLLLKNKKLTKPAAVQPTTTNNNVQQTVGNKPPPKPLSSSIKPSGMPPQQSTAKLPPTSTLTSSPPNKNIQPNMPQQPPRPNIQPNIQPYIQLQQQPQPQPQQQQQPEEQPSDSYMDQYDFEV